MFLYLWSIVQIIAESLPISSSGHVELLQRIMLTFNLIDYENCHNLWAFDYVLQGVSALLFLIYFFTSWWQLVVQRPISIAPLLDGAVWRKNILPVILFGVVADGVTFIFWVCFNYFQMVEQIDLQLPLTCGFMITAAALWSVQYAREKFDNNIWSLRSAALVGFVQGCALLSGISRFGTTFAALCWLGYSPRLAFSISFLVQWPLIVAGSLLGLYNLWGSHILSSMVTTTSLIVIVVAACVGYGMLCAVGRMIDNKTLWKFSYYMIIPICLSMLF